MVPSEFPCDLFEYAFNVKAWQDSDGDNFCEARMPKVAFEAPDGNTYQLYPEEAFLYQYALKIKPTSGNTALVRADQLFTGTLGTTDSGLIWCQQDCLPNNGVVGSVTKPVAVVADPGTNTPYHATLFGLLFWAVAVGFVAYLLVRVLPTVNEVDAIRGKAYQDAYARGLQEGLIEGHAQGAGRRGCGRRGRCG